MNIQVLPAAILAVAGTVMTSSSRSLAQQSHSMERDRAAIERLHQLDIEATISGKADDLTKLWDEDAVRLLPNSPVEIGRAGIYAADKRVEAAGVSLNACYKHEIRDLQIAGDWAFEWGYFSYKGVGMEKAIYGKVMRVIRRQADGSWKYSRVMALKDDEGGSIPPDSCK